MESGIIAVLISLLMVTYLAAVLAAEERPAAQCELVAHTLALLIFLPLIPHTKHLHLMLSPVTIFLSRGSFSRIPPLAGDEDFGLVTGKDITQHGRAAGLLVRRMRTLHGALSRKQHGKGAGPEEDHAGRAQLPRDMARAEPSRSSASTFRKRRCSNARPAARANINVRWASSTCRSSSACGAAW